MKQENEPLLTWVKEWKTLLHDENLNSDELIELFDDYANRQESLIRLRLQEPLDDIDMEIGTFGLDL